MIKKLLAKKVFWCAFAVAMFVPAVAFAAEGAAVEWQVGAAKAIAAGITMAFSALAAGYAQAKIGAAAAGTLAERPEVATNLIVLQALPEVIVLMGFVIAFMVGAA